MTFHDLHEGDTPLLLPNAWDVASAAAFVDSGFPAVGTTSFGVGAAAGHADGARASRDATLALVHALIGLPAYVSADIEDGYADAPEEVAAYVAELGAAGINIEDSTDEALIDPATHAAKIAAIRDRNPGVFINALNLPMSVQLIDSPVGHLSFHPANAIPHHPESITACRSTSVSASTDGTLSNSAHVVAAVHASFVASKPPITQRRSANALVRFPTMPTPRRPDQRQRAAA